MKHYLMEAMGHTQSKPAEDASVKEAAKLAETIQGKDEH